MEKMGFNISGILLDKMSTDDPEIVNRLRGVDPVRPVILDKIDIWMYIDKEIFNEWLASAKKTVRLFSWDEDLAAAKEKVVGYEGLSDVKRFKKYVATKYRFSDGKNFTKQLGVFGRRQRARNLLDEELRRKFLALLEA
jgi:hypothetical protein